MGGCVATSALDELMLMIINNHFGFDCISFVGAVFVCVCVFASARGRGVLKGFEAQLQFRVVRFKADGALKLAPTVIRLPIPAKYGF